MGRACYCRYWVQERSCHPQSSDHPFIQMPFQNVHYFYASTFLWLIISIASICCVCWWTCVLEYTDMNLCICVCVRLCAGVCKIVCFAFIVSCILLVDRQEETHSSTVDWQNSTSTRGQQQQHCQLHLRNVIWLLRYLESLRVLEREKNKSDDVMQM